MSDVFAQELAIALFKPVNHDAHSPFSGTELRCQIAIVQVLC
jgi:hypothetical protein